MNDPETQTTKETPKRVPGNKAKKTLSKYARFYEAGKYSGNIIEDLRGRKYVVNAQGTWRKI